MKDNVLEIDLNHLEVECARQPKLVFQAIRDLQKAKAQVTYEKQVLDVTVSELSTVVRKGPKKYGLKSPASEAAIKIVIPSLNKHKNQQEKLNEAMDSVGVYDALVQALDHKKRMLENEVKLHGQNYFATPYVKDASWAELIGDEEQVQSRKRKKKKRKKKSNYKNTSSKMKGRQHE